MTSVTWVNILKYTLKILWREKYKKHCRCHIIYEILFRLAILVGVRTLLGLCSEVLIEWFDGHSTFLIDLYSTTWKYVILYRLCFFLKVHIIVQSNPPQSQSNPEQSGHSQLQSGHWQLVSSPWTQIQKLQSWHQVELPPCCCLCCSSSWVGCISITVCSSSAILTLIF